jgi:gluconokinase
MFKFATVIMGVSSCGKTSVGQALAEKLSASFNEGDKLHPAANVAKMSAGIPLNDDDRWPWLEQVGKTLQGHKGSIVSCSALKRAYRDYIIKIAKRPVYFVFLDGSREVLEKRIAERKGHFMPPSLLASQLATLERPSTDELVMGFDISKSVDVIVAEAADWLLQQ